MARDCSLSPATLSLDYSNVSHMVTASTDLGPIFDRLGLGRYLERFLDEGFETWETVVDITESDLCVHSGNSSAFPAYHPCKRRIRRQTRPSTGTCSLNPGPQPWPCLATNGHQRLQREIANARGVDLDIITTATSSSKPHHVIQLDADDGLDLPPAGGPGRAKRKYRRHPKVGHDCDRSLRIPSSLDCLGILHS